MILYCSALSVKKEYMTNSFICKKIKELNDMWDYRVFTDFLDARDRAILLKSICTQAPIVFLSLESAVHGMHYWRPYSFSRFNISHKKLDAQKTLYYTVFSEEILSSYLIDITPNLQKKEKILFISSNTNKISYVKSRFGNNFKNVDFYGSFTRSIPYNSGNFHQDSQRLMSEYEATIVLENSEENGYIQGNFMRAIKAGSVPILGASEAIRRNVLDPKSYVNFEDYLMMTNLERRLSISRVSDHLKKGGATFSSVINDYLDFMKNGDFENMDKMIQTSQWYRKKIFD